MGLPKIKKYLQFFFQASLIVCSGQMADAGVFAVTATSDVNNAYYQYKYTDSPKYHRIYLDTDRMATTGFNFNGIGADYMLENNYLYRYAGSGSSRSWTFLKKVPMSNTFNLVKWTVARVDLKLPSALNLVAQMNAPLSTSGIVSQTLFAVAPAVSLAVEGAPNLPLNGTTTKVTVGFVIGTPIKVELSRDGYAAFAVWPTDSSFTLSADGKSLTRMWCISSSCWKDVSGAHVLNVIATYANGLTAKASVNVTVLTPTPTPTPVPEPAPASTGPTYYISPSGSDSNAGIQSAPWRTIKKAASVVNPGDTVVLLNGSYEESEIAFRRSGTASKPITIMAQNKWQAILNSTSGCHPGFSIYASYIKIKNIRFSVSPRNVHCETYTSANVHIRAWNTVVPTPSNPTTGTVGFHADGIKVDVTPYRDEGVKSNQDFTVIENSEIGNTILFLWNKDSVIRNNVVTGQDEFGISILVKGGARNIQVYGNVVHNKVANGQGIIIGGYSCDACHFDTLTNIEAYNSVAYNNVVINESSGAMAGLMFQGAKDSAFFNNVVIGGQMAMTVGGHNTGPRAPTSNPVFKNNIFVCNGRSLTSGYFGWAYTGILGIDYNNFHNCSGTSTQAHVISGDPNFMNPSSDWRLQPGSPAINSGTPVTFTGYGGVMIDISRDKNGVIRTAPWDLGIYNY